MFKEAIEKWNMSAHEREDKFILARELREALIGAKLCNGNYESEETKDA